MQEGGKTYRVIIANMGSINPGVTVSGMPNYPGIGEDYARTFLAQKDMKIDVWLASHAVAVPAARQVQARRPLQPRSIRRSEGVPGGGAAAREDLPGSAREGEEGQENPGPAD